MYAQARLAEIPEMSLRSISTEIRERVEGLQWVRYAMVQRVLPDRSQSRSSNASRSVWRESAAKSYQFDAEARVARSGYRGAGINFPILDGLEAGRYLRETEEGRISTSGSSKSSWAGVNSPKFISTMPVKFPSFPLSDPLIVNLGSE